MQAVGARLPDPISDRARNTLFWAVAVSMAALIYAFTPLTYALDDIKVAILFCLFPPILAGYFALLARGRVPAAPAPLNVLLGLYMGVMLLSTLTSRHSWVGWQLTGMMVAGLGIYYGAVGSVRTRKDFERLVLAMTLLCFGAIVFGLLHRLKFFTMLQDHWYRGASPASPRSMVHLLVITLARSDDEMMSTILNRDFFAAYLNMMIPPALALALVSGSSWVRKVSAATVGLGALCILLTISKNDYVALLITPFLFFPLYWRFARVRPIRIPNWRIWLIGISVVCATVVFLRWPLFANQLKLDTALGFGASLKSRQIIWTGALGIFADHPILGGGPGSFRILFPLYRDPDHHLHDISSMTLFAHNMFLDYLAETGAAGFLLIMGFMAALALMSLRLILRDPDIHLRALQLGLLCGLLAMVQCAATSPFNRWPIGFGPMYLLLGAMAAGLNVSRLAGPAAALPRWSAKWRSGPSRAPAVWGFCAAACVAAGFCLMFGVRYFAGAMAHNNALLQRDFAGTLDAWRKSAEMFETALRRNPYFLTSYYNLGNVAHNLFRLDPQASRGQVEQALDVYRRLQRLAPDYAEIHYNLGIIFDNLADLSEDAGEKLRHMEAAVAELEEAARQSSKLLTRRMEAQAREKLAHEIVLRDPGEIDGAGVVRNERARAELERAVEIYEELLQYPLDRPDVRAAAPEGDPGLLLTRKAYGMALQQLGRGAEAMEALAQYLRERPGDDEASRALAWAMDHAKDFERIEEILADLVSANPLRHDYRYYRLKFFQKMGRFEEAWQEAERAMKLMPGETRTMLAAAEILLQLGRHGDARPLLQALAEGEVAEAFEGRKAQGYLRQLEQATTPTPGAP